MPSFPEFQDIGRFIRGIKIKGQFIAHHSRNSHSHIAIPAKIKVKLKGIGKHNDKRVPGIQGRRIPIAEIRRLPESIRKKRLLR